MKQSTGSDRPGSPLRIEQDGKFFPRLAAKRSSLSDDAPSFRLYHGVPFVWESKPGKPKTADASSALPPLTPPPRYYYAEDRHSGKNKSKKNNSSRFKLMVEIILGVFIPRMVRRPLLPASPSQLPVSSRSSPFSRLGSSRSSTSSSMSFRSGDDDGSEGRSGSTRSAIVCFRVRRVPCTFFYCGRG